MVTSLAPLAACSTAAEANRGIAQPARAPGTSVVNWRRVSVMANSSSLGERHANDFVVVARDQMFVRVRRLAPVSHNARFTSADLRVSRRDESGPADFLVSLRG